MPTVTPVHILLFENFETLDAFGPAGIIGRLTDRYTLRFYSPLGGTTHSAQGIAVPTASVDVMEPGGILLIPGGLGTRTLAGDEDFLSLLSQLAIGRDYLLSVCTGSALLAAAGLLDGRRATTNKRAYDWATAQGSHVHWQRQARWVADGNIYTSSGVTAGMDMILGFIADREGLAAAREIARAVEYMWHEDPHRDPFA